MRYIMIDSRAYNQERAKFVALTPDEPMAHPANAALLLREDTVSEQNDRESLQEPAPSTQDGYFLVPRVIE